MMNFGDILDQWDQQTAKTRKGGKGGSGSGKAGKEPERVDPLMAWLRVHGIYDKDAEEEKAVKDD
ncbi:MAG: DNA mismatch repair protein MutS, partial [Treponema sp.]|nr:DNA mismatch repair protein MutS [Treponema sp.]